MLNKKIVELNLSQTHKNEQFERAHNNPDDNTVPKYQFTAQFAEVSFTINPTAPDNLPFLLVMNMEPMV